VENKAEAFGFPRALLNGEMTLYPQGSLVDPLRGVSGIPVKRKMLTPLYFCFETSSDKLSPCSSPGRSARTGFKPNLSFGRR
jgi:hypothetical protein